MKHCKDCIHADKGAKEHPCNDCAQLKQGGGRGDDTMGGWYEAKR